MIEGKLSRRYATALFQLARDAKREEETLQELERIGSVYSAPPLSAVLNNPAFRIDSRKRLVLEVAHRLNLSSLTVRLLSLLLDRDRLNYLESITVYYRRLQDEALGRVHAKVIAAASLTSGDLDHFRAALSGISGKNVVLEQATETRLIGGLVVEMEGRIYDGSLRTQLEKMTKQIEQGY
jgi:F-type H+-transporting ATPase subunit delta